MGRGLQRKKRINCRSASQWTYVSQQGCIGGCCITVPRRRQALDCARISPAYRYSCFLSALNPMAGSKCAEDCCKVGTTSLN
ncbi:hypothetical protein C0J52_05623 [Blattella germanica]|nr:hypothetical protein C0J52_05623 [Blattella germanica]